MEPAVLLKHVAVWSQVCLPATQHVIAARNKHESVKTAKTDRVKLHLQCGHLLHFICSCNTEHSHQAALISKDSTGKTLETHLSVFFYAVARSALM